VALNKNVLNKINKYLEKQGVESRIQKGAENIEVKFLTTGIPEVDYVFSGGMPLGRVIHLYGQKSSGKSWLCQRAIAQAQKRGMTCAFLDCEGTYSTDWAKNLGVNVEELIYIPVSNAEVTLQVMRELVESNGVDLIVLDSIAALTPKDELDKSFDEEAKMAGTARLMSKAMRVLNSKGSGKVTMMFINQIRDSMDKYSGPTTPGGRAVGFYATTEINVSRGKAITKGTGNDAETIGYEMRIVCDKNKVGVPKRKCVLRVFNDGSIDLEDMVVNMGTQNDIWGQFNKNGNSYFLGEEKIAGKREDFVEYLKKNQEEFNKYSDTIVATLLKKDKDIKIVEEKVEELTEEELVERVKNEISAEEAVQ
jgi:recombination protein RecA